MPTENNPFANEEQVWLTNVMPCHNDGKRVADAMMSVLNQDYPYTELIVVNDGSTDDSKKKILKCQKEMTEEQRSRFKFIDLPENKGACVARNLGAKEAKGKYISFLPADAFLYPGAVRFWVTELETNPDKDGIYGGYRFIDEKKPFGLQDNEGYNIPGDYFNPYLLETSNYIDGTFPMKKELFDKMGGWDPEIKSLQDYEYWLRAVKLHGAKLLYSPALFFETDLPHAGGLSFDSNANWLERMDAIKKKLGIPIRELCVIAFGAQFHAVKTAQLLNADFSTNPNFKPNHYKAFYIMGGYPMFAADLAGVLQQPDGKGYVPAKFIMHWIGSDLMALRDLPRTHLEKYTAWLKNIIDVHLVEAKHTQAELFDLTGIKARIVPLPSERMFDVKPFPEKKTVAVYQPGGEFNYMLYQGKLMEAVAKKMPDVRFIFYGTNSSKHTKGNITRLPFTDAPGAYEKIIADSTVLLRITVHDGLPLAVAEFASAGRHIVTNVPVPHVRHISGSITVDGIVQTIREAFKDGINDLGAVYYRKLFDKKKFVKSIEKCAEYDPKSYWEHRGLTWGVGLDKYFTDHEKKVVTKLMKELQPKSVIDVGCGYGNWSEVLTGDYLGVDIADSMVKKAREKYPDKTFLTVSLEGFINPMDPKRDLAFCHTIFMHIKDDKIGAAVASLKNIAKQAIIIEPNNIETGFYQIKHDIPKLFNVIRTIPMPDRTLYLCNLE